LSILLWFSLAAKALARTYRINGARTELTISRIPISEMATMKIGTPLSSSAAQGHAAGAGELGKEVIIALQRLGVEVIAVRRCEHAPGQRVAHRSHVINMTDARALRAVVPLAAAGIAARVASRAASQSAHLSLLVSIRPGKEIVGMQACGGRFS
jgi:hypothetical protein